jgi:hypothetical protein
MFGALHNKAPRTMVDASYPCRCRHQAVTSTHSQTLMSIANSPQRPIIIVTGANKYVPVSLTPPTTLLNHPHPSRDNSGVGFGICRRLLYGLAQNSPDDARSIFPQLPRTGGAERGPRIELEYHPYAGATLIMACRSRQRAEAARAQLLELFERDVARLRTAAPGGAERVAAFRANLVIAIHVLDLASARSTLAFADEVART